MVERTMMGAGAVTVALVVLLGLWGWADSDESAARHAAAVSLRSDEDQEQFCRELGYAVGPLVGRLMDVDVALTLPVDAEPPMGELDPVDAALSLDYLFNGLIDSAPEVLREPLTVVGSATREAIERQDPSPLLSARVREALGELEKYWDEYCAP